MNLSTILVLYFAMVFVEVFSEVPCPDAPCGIDCKNGFQKDANGCQLCACLRPPPCDPECPVGEECKEVAVGCENPPPGQPCDPYLAWKCVPITCPDIPCAIRCRYGLQHDKNGCQICNCLPHPCAAVSCLFGQPCSVFRSSCDGPSCDPFVGLCGPVGCPAVECRTKCDAGYATDKKGCLTCKCLDRCQSKCSKNEECKQVVSGCENPPPGQPCDPIVMWKCVSKCPQLKCKTCLGGNVIDANGCMTCQCLNPCLGITCLKGEICQPTAPGSSVRYQCVKPKNLCCPKPTAPPNAHLIRPGKCFPDCQTMKCGGETMCCPNWLGCYGCLKAVPC